MKNFNWKHPPVRSLFMNRDSELSQQAPAPYVKKKKKMFEVRNRGSNFSHTMRHFFQKYQYQSKNFVTWYNVGSVGTLHTYNMCNHLMCGTLKRTSNQCYVNTLFTSRKLLHQLSQQFLSGNILLIVFFVYLRYISLITFFNTLVRQ